MEDEAETEEEAEAGKQGRVSNIRPIGLQPCYTYQRSDLSPTSLPSP